MENGLFVVLGGGIGALLRYLSIILFTKFFGASHLNTLLVNIIGCFILGLILSFEVNRSSSFVQSFFCIGVLGGFTTFSSFSYESLVLLQKGQVINGLAYNLFSPVIGILAAFIGTTLIK